MSFNILNVSVDAEAIQDTIPYIRAPLNILNISVDVERRFEEVFWYRPAFEIRSISIEIGEVTSVYQRTIQVI